MSRRTRKSLHCCWLRFKQLMCCSSSSSSHPSHVVHSPIENQPVVLEPVEQLVFTDEEDDDDGIDYRKPLEGSPRILLTLKIVDRNNYLRKDLVTPRLKQLIETVSGPLRLLTPFQQDSDHGVLRVLATSDRDDVLAVWCHSGEWRTIGRGLGTTFHIAEVVRVPSTCKTVASAVEYSEQAHNASSSSEQ